MSKFLISTLIAVSAFSISGLATAAGKAGGPSHGSVASTANSNSKNASDRDFGKERAADRAARKKSVKSQAAINSNGVKSLDRDKGQERAADRRHRNHRKTTKPTTK